MTATVELITAEAFWAMLEKETRRELVRGEVVEHIPPGALHGLIAATLTGMLRDWVRRSTGTQSRRHHPCAGW
jgi:Uma2 family endonuclease